MGPNQYQVTAGFGQRMLNSIIGIPIGIIMIIVGIGLLYWNEGRYDYSKLAKTAIEVPAGQPAPAGAQGKLVAIDGTAKSPEKLGDTYLKAGQYLLLRRVVEEYAWTEESHSHDNNGGSQTTTYTYQLKWTDDVADSSAFKQPDGHINPPKAIEDREFRVTSASMESYKLDMNLLNMPSPSRVDFTTANTVPSGLKLSGNALYNHDPQNPQPGDVRVSYEAVSNPFQGVVLGKLDGSTLSTFADNHNHTLFRLFSGNKDAAVSQLHNEFRLLLWIFRGAGFILIFIGLTLLVGPLTTLLDFFPTIGHIGGAIVAIIAFPVALLLSAVTILVGMIAHNPVALAITLILAAAVSVWWIRFHAGRHAARDAAVATAPAPDPAEPVQPTEPPAAPPA